MYSTSHCILQGLEALNNQPLGAAGTKKKPKTKAVESGKMCLQIPLRTGSVSKPGLVGYGHGSQGDTLSLQSTHCDDGRDGAAGWDSAYTWGWKRLFPRCKSLCNSYLDMGLSMPAQERQPVSKVCKATDGG